MCAARRVDTTAFDEGRGGGDGAGSDTYVSSSSSRESIVTGRGQVTIARTCTPFISHSIQDLGVLNGSYSDFERGWYATVGVAVAMTMLINVIVPHVGSLVG